MLKSKKPNQGLTMKLKNNSARGHWLGAVLIAPLETKEVGDEWRNAYNKTDLEEIVDKVVEVSEPSKRGRPAKVADAE
jgi:hypothetical protein